MTILNANMITAASVATMMTSANQGNVHVGMIVRSVRAGVFAIPNVGMNRWRINDER